MDLEANKNDIAIIGMSCRYPKANDIKQFWRNICDSQECITYFSEEELLANFISKSELEDSKYVKANGILENIDLFDASFFGFTPTEAEILPPQTRLFMECVWEAIEDGALNLDTYQGLVSIYAGSGLNSYLLENVISNKNSIDAALGLQLRIFNDKDFLPLHTSYKLNLKGPSVNVQTACSTSLVAIHMACQSLLNGECDTAIAGGASVDADQVKGYYYGEGFINSKDGHCRPFDEAASGSVGSSGVGVVLLKRLEDAVIDNDNIYAVIKGSAINNDGNTKLGFTAPSIEGQVDVIAEAMAMADVNGSMISYVETHGTGTRLGDPIEIEALTKAFVDSGNVGKCAIGSVKSNIGHTDTAAGVAGVIKTALSLKNKVLPPSINFKKANPKIDFKHNPFYVNTKLNPWVSNSKRFAGISSFGIGGTNAHLILGEAPEFKKVLSEGPEIILISAKSEGALDDLCKELSEFIKQNDEISLSEIAYTLKVGRKFFEYKKFFICNSKEELIKQLQESSSSYQSPVENMGISFMFPGGGAHHLGMGKDLYQKEQVFRETFDQCSSILLKDFKVDLKGILEGVSKDQVIQELFDKAEYALPYLFIVEYSLARLLIHWDIRPNSMIGHSVGEYVAACISEVFSLEDALKIIATRGRLFDTLPKGAMTTVFMSEEELKQILPKTLDIAAINGPNTCVVSGLIDDISQFEQVKLKNNFEFKRLHINIAAHSRAVENILEDFKQCLLTVELKKPKIPFVSNLSGDWITEKEAIDLQYWVRHLRNSVRFSDGIKNLLVQNNNVLLEVGPGRSLSTLCLSNPNKRHEMTVVKGMPAVNDNLNEYEHLLTSIGKVWSAGFNVNWEASLKDIYLKKVPLPTYPFQRKRYWLDKKAPNHSAIIEPSTNEKLPVQDSFYVPSWKRSVQRADRNFETVNKLENNILVFKDCNGLADKLCHHLASGSKNLITVEHGDEFESVNNYHFKINPRNETDYQRLIDELVSRDLVPSKIAHFFSITEAKFHYNDGVLDAKAVYDNQQLGFHSVLYLSKSLINSKIEDEVQIICVTNNSHFVLGNEELNLSTASLLGALKVIPKEFKNIQCVNIDLSISDRADHDAACGVLLNFISQSEIKNSTEIAVRNNYLWTPAYEKLTYDQIKSGHEVQFKDDGVYLITGGLGEVGMLIAENIASSTKNAKIILIGRTTFPDRETWSSIEANLNVDLFNKIKKITAIESNGASVETFKCDVSNFDQVETLKEHILCRFGSLNGIIHAAGFDTGGGVILLKDQQIIDKVFASKIKGTLNLSNVFNDVELDFLALFSSINSILPNIGQADYCGASLFLDAFAHYRMHIMGKHTTTINWDRWHSTGSSISMEQQHKQITGEDLEEGMTHQEGLQKFRIALQTNMPQVICANYSLLPRIKENKEANSNVKSGIILKNEKQIINERPKVSTQYVAPRNHEEEQIEGIWRNIIGLDKIGVHDDLFEIGGHSLMAAQIISHIRATLETDIPLADFFKNPTISNLAEIVRSTKSSETDLAHLKIEKISRENHQIPESNNSDK
jgi:acyl transferase domain-containing protein